MRRSEREIKGIEEIAEVLKRCPTLRVGFHGEEYPYVLPLSFGFEIAEGKIIIYAHGAKEGLKNDFLAKNSKVCVEADILHEFVKVGQGYFANYESVIGFGNMELVHGDEAIKGLYAVLEHSSFANQEYDHSIIQAINLYKITLDSVTGKRCKV